MGFGRMEKLEIGKVSSQAKIWGTVGALGGATLMTIYKGVVVISPHTHTHTHTSYHQPSKAFLDWEWIKGSLCLLTSMLSLSAFYLLQVPTTYSFLEEMMILSASYLKAVL